MDLQEFISSKAIRGHIEQQSFSADIFYSEAGSGHFFTLIVLKLGKIADLHFFLNKWEAKYTFRIEMLVNQTARDKVIERGYTADLDGSLYIGVAPESEAERNERRMRDKKILPRGGGHKSKISVVEKGKVANKIAKRELSLKPKQAKRRTKQEMLDDAARRSVEVKQRKEAAE